MGLERAESDPSADIFGPNQRNSDAPVASQQVTKLDPLKSFIDQ
jgi:hypothetical protein